MTLKSLLSVTLIALLCWACESPATPAASDTPTDTPPVEETPPDDRIPLPLHGWYATSTASDSDLKSGFDRDAQSAWLTIPGAGPDEGVMLYFADNTYLESIQIEVATGPGIAAVKMIEIYANGSPMGIIAPGETFTLGENYRNIYLRINEVQRTRSLPIKVDNPYYDTFLRHEFARDYQTGFANVRLMGREGEYRVVPPIAIAGRVQATSRLNPEQAAYQESHLFDARREFGWVEGADGNGIGEQLRFQFDLPVQMTHLQFWNGYQRSNSHYKANARLQNFTFGTDVDSMQAAYQLADDPLPQKIRLARALSGRDFALTIASAYRGRSYQDLALSELLFFDEDQAFVIDSDYPEQLQRQIKTACTGTVLGQLLDRRVANTYTSEAGAREDLSAIMRSDGTFVMYTKAVDELGTSAQTLADGNWEIIEAGPESARLRVFGKYLNFSDLELYYQGKTEVELTRIFKDEITISGNTVQGKKYLDAVVFR